MALINDHNPTATDCMRECLALVPDTFLSGQLVARELDTIVRESGCRPDTIVSDNGTEYTSNAILVWADESFQSVADAVWAAGSNRARRARLSHPAGPIA